ncbi:hypothetical protein KCP75_12085 [Salmonella enterica subsp. enterica]|nr:hypothetical protein KCP75_12085 [Salmonella enterica subsp. enterica]
MGTKEYRFSSPWFIFYDCCVTISGQRWSFPPQKTGFNAGSLPLKITTPAWLLGSVIVIP